MGNYALATYTTPVSSLSGVAAAIEAKLETVDTVKNIRSISIQQVGGGNQFKAVLVYDA